MADLRVALERGGVSDYTEGDAAVDALGQGLTVSRVEHSVNKAFPRAHPPLTLAGKLDWNGNVLSPPLFDGDLSTLIPPDTRMVVYAEVPAGRPGGGPSELPDPSVASFSAIVATKCDTITVNGKSLLNALLL